MTCGEESSSFAGGNVSGLDYPVFKEGERGRVAFDLTGGRPSFAWQSYGNMGRPGGFGVDPGTYWFEGLRLVHDGEKATFTTPEGGSFWVGIAGFGVN